MAKHKLEEFRGDEEQKPAEPKHGRFKNNKRQAIGGGEHQALAELEQQSRITRRPTNFLDLPSELRQDILSYTYSEYWVTLESLKLQSYWTFMLVVIEQCYKLCDKVMRWSTKLRKSNAQILDDVNYLEGKWMEEWDVITERFEELEKEEKGIGQKFVFG
jgi:hypothetical protein